MPNLDGGHYFLTALVPVAVDPVARADGSITAPSHALRETLASLPTAMQSATSVTSDRVSPFARCTRTHFARLFVLDQPMFNGRDPTDAIVQSLKKTDFQLAQPVDCMPTPWLVVILDFDARDAEADGGLDSYLHGLWDKMQPEMQAVFGTCWGFGAIKSASDFAAYIKRCQIETTMPFNDYWGGAPPFASLSLGQLGGIAGAVLAGLVLLEFVLLRGLGIGLGWLWPGVPLAAAAAIYALYRYVLHRARTPFPTAPASDLPSVLKGLYLQQKFVAFAAAHQTDDPAALHAAFGQFLAETSPANTAAPTRLPGRVAA